MTSNIRIEIVVEGIANDRPWSCGLEFDYANEESFYCRPLRLTHGAGRQDPGGPPNEWRFRTMPEGFGSPTCRPCPVWRLRRRAWT